MSVNPYKPLSWGDNEPIWTQKLNQMTNNDEWLYENAGRFSYSAYGVSRTSGIKLACGLVLFPAAKVSSAIKTVYFSDFFSTGCRPVIATSLLYGRGYLIHHAISGIGERFPDHRGFTVAVAHQTGIPSLNYFDVALYIQWIAMGF